MDEQAYRDLGLVVGDPDEVVFMMITAGKVDLGGPAGGGPLGRRVCYAREWEHGVVMSQRLPNQ